MTNTELQNILVQGESETVEFKLNFNNETIISINAFANNKGGQVVIGVSDKGEIKGISINQESIQNWLNELKQKTEPSLFPGIESIEINKKTIVVISVQEFPIKPVSFKGRYYIRNNNSNHLLSADQIVETRFNSLNLSFDSFPVSARFENLDQEALALFSTNLKVSGRFKPSANLLNDFKKLGFSRDKKLTRASELLFGTHHTSIHIGRFKSAATIIDDTVIRSPLVLAVEETMDFIKKNIALGYEFTGELQRKERWQYPLQAIREIVLNAIVHKDYRDPTDIIIKIFDNSIEISNPGRLFGNLTIDDLNGDNYQPKHRNKLLAEAFYLMGEVEKYGTGFIRIRDWLKEYPKLNFNIIDLGDFTRVVLETAKDVTKDVTKDVIKDVIKEQREKVILELIRLNAQITTTEMANILKLTPRTALREIDKLKKNNKIKRTGGRKKGYWEIIE